jgi:hypothetical protein
VHTGAAVSPPRDDIADFGNKRVEAYTLTFRQVGSGECAGLFERIEEHAPIVRQAGAERPPLEDSTERGEAAPVTPGVYELADLSDYLSGGSHPRIISRPEDVPRQEQHG